MNGEPFFKGLEAVGKVIFAAIVGAFTMSLTLLAFELMDKYFTHRKSDNLGAAVSVIFGFLIGGIIGGFVGITRPNPRNALYTSIITSVILVLLGLSIDFRYLSALISEGSYSGICPEINFLIGSGLAFILSIWIPAKIVSVS